MTSTNHELAHPFGTEIKIQEIVEQFSTHKAWEDKYRLLIQFARKLPALSDDEKLQTQEVKGCETEFGLEHFSMMMKHFIFMGIVKAGW